MTDAEWFGCADLAAMLESLRGRTSERKLRLFAGACCRHLPFETDERFRLAVEVTERYADGQTTKAALKRARQSVRAARHALPTPEPAAGGVWSAYWLAEVAATENAYMSVAAEIQRLVAEGMLDLPPDKQSFLRANLHDLFGNPFRAVSLDPAWRTADVVRLAAAVYAERAFDRLPILADALEEAGCTNAEVLDHCRGAGLHVRGCWLLDLVLGKT